MADKENHRELFVSFRSASVMAQNFMKIGGLLVGLSLAACETPEPSPCDNSCALANDGACDDGRLGAVSALCVLGSDCNDCASLPIPDVGPRRDVDPDDSGMPDSPLDSGSSDSGLTDSGASDSDLDSEVSKGCRWDLDDPIANNGHLIALPGGDMGFVSRMGVVGASYTIPCDGSPWVRGPDSSSGSLRRRLADGSHFLLEGRNSALVLGTDFSTTPHPVGDVSGALTDDGLTFSPRNCGRDVGRISVLDAEGEEKDSSECAEGYRFIVAGLPNGVVTTSGAEGDMLQCWSDDGAGLRPQAAFAHGAAAVTGTPGLPSHTLVRANGDVFVALLPHATVGEFTTGQIIGATCSGEIRFRIPFRQQPVGLLGGNNLVYPDGGWTSDGDLILFLRRGSQPFIIGGQTGVTFIGRFDGTDGTIQWLHLLEAEGDGHDEQFLQFELGEEDSVWLSGTRLNVLDPVTGDVLFGPPLP